MPSNRRIPRHSIPEDFRAVRRLDEVVWEPFALKGVLVVSILGGLRSLGPGRSVYPLDFSNSPQQEGNVGSVCTKAGVIFYTVAASQQIGI